MKRFIVVFSVLLMLACSCCGRCSNVDFKTITDRIATDIMEHPADSVINEILAAMTEDGLWTDVDYESTSPYNWSPKYHIYRLFTMSSAFIDEKSRYYHDPVILSRITKGLYKWMELKPSSSNWFVKAIQEPLKIGGLLVLLESASVNLPEDIHDYLLELLHDSTKSPYDFNDFNRTSVAEHWIYRACVEKDAETLEIAVSCIFDLQKINIVGDGYKLDGSFFHGGPQFYIGSYCSGAIRTVINTGFWVRDTDFEMSSEHLAVLRNFLTKVYPSCVRGFVINYDCVGRAITERNNLDASSMAISFERMKELDPEYETLYSQTLKSLRLDITNNESTHYHYWIGDYTTHARKLYSCSVGLCSTRSMKPEYGLSGNLYGYFLSDGNTCLVTTGKEYYNIAPVWDWNFIPGTTAPLIDEIPLQKTAFGCYGTYEFAGGVTDSLCGVATYKYYDDYKGINTGANKGYFFFDDEVVCLGSNIESDHQVVTTVEQCWGDENVSVLYHDNSAGFSRLSGDVCFEKSVECVIHQGNAYYFPRTGANVICKNKNKQGNWFDLDSSQKDTIIGGRVFLLSINHVMQERSGDNYSYIIVPGTNEKDMLSYIEKSDIEICANTDSLQVVRHKSLGIWEMIFYKGCKFWNSDMDLCASKPCAIIYKYGSDGKPLVHVSDPGQTGADINIRVNDYMTGKSYDGTISFNDTPKEYWGATKVANLTETTTGINTLLICACNGGYILYDVNGRLIHSFKGEDTDVVKNKIKYPGLYILKMRGQSGSQKLIVR